MLLPTGPIQPIVFPQSRKEFFKAGNNVISPRTCQPAHNLYFICLLKPFNFNPQRLTGRLDLPAALSVGHVEHRLLVHLEGGGVSEGMMRVNLY